MKVHLVMDCVQCDDAQSATYKPFDRDLAV